MLRVIVITLCFVFVITAGVSGQVKNRYILGEEETLNMLVFVIGEVNNPGEYLVPDHTDLAEMLARAGGPARYGKLSNVIITRYTRTFSPSGIENRSRQNQSGSGDSADDFGLEKQVIKFNLENFLKSENGGQPPPLKPGDIIYVKKNKWYKWTMVSGVLRDLAVVASAYFLYLRATDDN